MHIFFEIVAGAMFFGGAAVLLAVIGWLAMKLVLAAWRDKPLREKIGARKPRHSLAHETTKTQAQVRTQAELDAFRALMERL